MQNSNGRLWTRGYFFLQPLSNDIIEPREILGSGADNDSIGFSGGTCTFPPIQLDGIVGTRGARVTFNLHGAA
jgi:hypothetical protein